MILKLCVISWSHPEAVSSAGGIDQDTIYDLDTGGDWQCGARMLSDDYEIAGRGSVRLMYSRWLSSARWRGMRQAAVRKSRL